MKRGFASRALACLAGAVLMAAFLLGCVLSTESPSMAGDTAKSYVIARVNSAPDWDEIDQLDIDDAEWGDSFGISAHAKLCYDDQALYVRMWADEQNVRATYMRDDPDAKCYEDSCLEFFLAPVVGDARYMNFEFNPNCILPRMCSTPRRSAQVAGGRSPIGSRSITCARSTQISPPSRERRCAATSTSVGT